MDAYERDYDQRQYGWMAYFIEQYQLGRISLSEIISRLEGLLAVLHETDPDWEAKFRTAWGQLELVYADVVIHDLSTLSEHYKTMISEALSELAALVQTKLVSPQIDEATPQ